ncbi:Protein lifeguard 2 [Anabarilius grahami]|uniref:Protein lifeguard 2 n=1 Tax=Anabarilius grahami TaxID=495550 RepID=A0A3N0Y9P3_ANAGA|nr:Protein lifeguard 2 [Anabarilius grahami]
MNHRQLTDRNLLRSLTERTHITTLIDNSSQKMTQKKVAPTVQTVEGNMPPSYDEANAGCPGYYYGEGGFSWDDTFIRRIFIRKVYSILMLQLFSTVAVIALFTFHFYNSKSVLLCIGITATVCLCVTIFSFQNKIDITSYQGLLFILCMVMFFCAIVMGLVVPFGYVPWLHAVYASIGAVVFTMFLAFDTQLLMGNKQYALSPEEYIFATLSLYLDIVYLFTFLLQLFGNGRE